jgi:hypothetical protein
MSQLSKSGSITRTGTSIPLTTHACCDPEHVSCGPVIDSRRTMADLSNTGEFRAKRSAQDVERDYQEEQKKVCIIVHLLL